MVENKRNKIEDERCHCKARQGIQESKPRQKIKTKNRKTFRYKKGNSSSVKRHNGQACQVICKRIGTSRSRLLLS